MDEIQRDAPIDEKTLVDLIRRAQAANDPVAFDGLYMLYADRIYRFLLARLGDVELTEEVVSHVFLQLLEKIDRYDIGPKDNATIFSAWFYRLAHNKMIDVLRKLKRTRHLSIEHAENVAEHHSMLETLEARIDFERLLSTLQMLNNSGR